MTTKKLILWSIGFFVASLSINLPFNHLDCLLNPSD